VGQYKEKQYSNLLKQHTSEGKLLSNVQKQHSNQGKLLRNVQKEHSNELFNRYATAQLKFETMNELRPNEDAMKYFCRYHKIHLNYPA
jgi:hypothetical protein